MLKLTHKTKIAISYLLFVALCSNAALPAINATVTANQTAASVYHSLSLFHLPSLAKQEQDETIILEALAKEYLELTKQGKANNIKLPSVQDVEKLALLYNVFNAHAVQHGDVVSAEKTLLDTTIINDLQIFCGDKENPTEHLSTRIPTTTTMGKVQLQRMLMEPTTDIAELQNRQAIIKELVTNEALFNTLEQQLASMSATENDFVWFWKAMAQEVSGLYDTAYWTADGELGTSKANKNALIMQALHSWHTHIGPVRGVASPAINMGVMLPIAGGIAYLLPDFINWIADNDQAAQYLQNAPLGAAIYNGLVAPYINAYETIQNGEYKAAPILLAAYITLGWSMAIYMSIAIAKLHNNIANDIQGHLIPAGTYAKGVDAMVKALVPNTTLRTLLPGVKTLAAFNHSASKEAQALIDNLNTATFQGEPSFFSNRGRVLSTYKMMLSSKNHFVDSMMAVGQLDAYMAIARLYKTHANKENGRYCFAEYEQADAPHIKATNFWMPMLNPDTVVTNDIEMGGDKVRDIIVTGPNAGGKSTCLKAALEAIIFAQTIGIVPADAMSLTPFTIIKSYMNIADTTGSASLYQAEIRRTLELIKAVKSLPKGQFAFVVMDEIFTGTNPKEAKRGAKLVVEDNIKDLDQCLCFFATHYKVLTTLASSYPSVIGNYKVNVGRNENGSIKFLYKLTPGISDQSIGLELAVEEGLFDRSILKHSAPIAA